MDVAVVGGGLIGLACARELSRSGLDVRIIDRGSQPASWAAAGILGPQSEAQGPGPSIGLGLKSLELWPQFVESLGDVGYRQCGTLHVAFDEKHARELDEKARWQRGAGLAVEDRKEPRALRSIFFPSEATVDNRRLLDALRGAMRQRMIHGNVKRIASGRVELEDGQTLTPKHIVLCGGAWSSELAKLPVFPVRGQMIALDVPPPPSIIFGYHCYVVPRRDRMIVGATSETVGFDGSTTPEGKEYLLSVAKKLVPGSETARVLEHWAGLRPGTPDALPFFGEIEPGIIAATGHFRNGILLAPVSAAIVKALITGATPPLALEPFAPSRRT